jgi:VWFA-related protein
MTGGSLSEPEYFERHVMAKHAIVRFASVVSGAVFTAGLLFSQTPPQAAGSSQSTPVFHATTRQVLVDVVAIDHRGAFIPNLKPTDFTLLEDGKPQKIVGFALHTTPAVPKDHPVLQLPAHQYANFTNLTQEPDRPVTIVLLDMLNTSGQGQQYARKQMLQFLKGLPPGRPVALFTLTSKLNMVQGFTGDSDALVKAATAVLANTPLLTSPEAQTQQEEIGARSLETVGAPSSMGPTPQLATSPIAPIGQAIRDALGSQDTFQKLQRMNITLNALDVLGRAVAGYPGRKNLVWLSAEFPVTFSPNSNPYNQAANPFNTNVKNETNHQLHDLYNEAPPMQQTAALLAAVQIAVYPIDVSGLVSQGTGIDITASTTNLNNPDLQTESQTAGQRQTTSLWDAHEAMTDIARQTGGEAFYGTNDLKGAMSRSMDEGSNYYTLAYSPANHDWNGKYRKIEVKSDNSAKLTFRRGYYAVPESRYNGDRASAAMTVAMRFSVPEFTMLFLKVQVLPPDAEHKKVRVDYAVDANDIAFADGPEQRKVASVDFVATAWDKDLNLVAHAGETMNTTLRPDAYAQVLRTGLPFHQELDLQPGTYTLRLGVLDRGNQKIGTVDVPLTIPGTSSLGAAKVSQ